MYSGSYVLPKYVRLTKSHSKASCLRLRTVKCWQTFYQSLCVRFDSQVCVCADGDVCVIGVRADPESPRDGGLW